MKKLFTLIILLSFSVMGHAQCTVSISAPQLYLCKGSTLTLQAGTGFQSYLWNNGATGSSLQITQGGTYTVKATTSANCVAFASVDIIALNKAAFTVNGSMKCDTSVYTFINQSGVSISNIKQFKWIFGDGSIYTSASPVVPADTLMWTNFQKKYTTTGTFIPKLILWYPGASCIDTFTLDISSVGGVRPPANWSTFVSIIVSEDAMGSLPVTKICKGSKLYLNNAVPFPTDMSGFSYTWSFSDPNANPPGSDYFMNNPNPNYRYQQKGSFIPKLTIQCPNKPNRTYNWYARIDSINNNSGFAVANPGIYTVHGFQFPQNQFMNKSRYVYSGTQRTDSLPDNWSFFGTLPADTSKKVKPANLFGYGVVISGAQAAIENASSGVTILNYLRCQNEGALPVEFTNATNNSGGGALYNRWNFDDKFSPRCTSYSVPNPAAANNGLPPYTNAADQINRTLGRFIRNGQVYIGRVSCNNSLDTLPIHQYQTYTNLLRWYRNGVDFPPYDSSSTGWTTNLSQVSPGGKKYVQPLDQASWGTPKFAGGSGGTRIDTMNGLFPVDIQPNSSIILLRSIPDPIAAFRGFQGFTIPAGTRVDTSGFLIPALSGLLPDNTNRSFYRGNTALPEGSGFKDLYEYFFNRSIPSAYAPSLQVSGAEGCSSTDSVLVISGKPDPCGIIITRESSPYMYGATKIDFSNTWPPSSLRTSLLLNYDSLSDRKDMTPCALDGFVNYAGTSPITGTSVTPGGNTFPPFNNYYQFSPFGWWTSPSGTVNRTHYIKAGPAPYSFMPYAENGDANIGVIIGSGCATVACLQPAVIADTIWYPKAATYKLLNGNFTLRKNSGFAGYGKNGFLAGQDTTIGYNPNNGEPLQWCRLYGKGDELKPTFDNPFPENLKSVAVDWGDKIIEVDSFNYNLADTIVSYSGKNYLIPKGQYVYNRMHYTYSSNNYILVLKNIQEFPLGQGRVITTKLDTIFYCNDALHHFSPQRIDGIAKVSDSSINLNFMTHRYQINSMDTAVTVNDLFYVNIGMRSQNGDNSMAYKNVAIGYLNTFTPEKIKPAYLVNEPIRFIDSIRYFNPFTSGTPFGPNRPLSPGETEFSPLNSFRLAMANYPADTLKIRPNPNRYYTTTGSGCLPGYVFTFGSPNICTKIDTFFYERIYWDFESDGKIDFAGATPVKSYTAPGTYIVSMITRDSVGYFDTVKKSITVASCLAFDPFPLKLSSCNDSVFYLTVGTNFNLNNWYMSGSTIPVATNTLFFPVKQDGSYRVEARNASSSCQYTDSVNTVFMNKVKIKQGNSVTKCSMGSDTLLLEPTLTAGYQFLWDGTLNQSKLAITKSDGVVKHVLKISKNGADCFDTSTTAFVERLRVAPATANLCIRDSVLITVLSNTAFGSNLQLQWKKDSNDVYSTGGFSKLNVYSNTGMHRPMVKQSYQLCNDSFTYNLFADPAYAPPHISGKNSVKKGDTINYSTPLVSGYTYQWVLAGGIVLSGAGTNQISVYWNTSATSGYLKVIKTGGFCSGTDSLPVSILSTGLNAAGNFPEALLYPNPATQTLTFAIQKQAEEDYKFRILDIEGRLIESGILNGSTFETTLDISGLNAGLYLLHISGEKGERTFRWVKQ